jgi:hypothetical protein
LNANGFPALTPRRASFARISVSSGPAGRELKREGQVVEEAGLGQLFVDRREVDRRYGGWEGYMMAEDITEYAKKDLVAGKQQREEAKARAEEVLKIAAAHPQEPAYSAAVMTAQHVLATAALRDGDRARALHHMRESVKVATSEG